MCGHHLRSDRPMLDSLVVSASWEGPHRRQWHLVLLLFIFSLYPWANWKLFVDFPLFLSVLAFKTLRFASQTSPFQRNSLYLQSHWRPPDRYRSGPVWLPTNALRSACVASAPDKSDVHGFYKAYAPLSNGVVDSAFLFFFFLFLFLLFILFLVLSAL